jgi:hypothetical protein
MSSTMCSINMMAWEKIITPAAASIITLTFRSSLLCEMHSSRMQLLITSKSFVKCNLSLVIFYNPCSENIFHLLRRRRRRPTPSHPTCTRVSLRQQCSDELTREENMSSSSSSSNLARLFFFFQALLIITLL